MSEPPHPYVGRSVPRVEDLPLVTGTAIFVDDVRRERELHARIVRSQVPHGRLVRVDADAVRARLGVAAVLTGAELPDVRIPIRLDLAATPQANLALQPPLARDRVRYVGEPVAVVVAQDRYLAEDAAGEVWVEVEELEPVLDVVRAAELPPIHSELGSNLVNDLTFRHGDVDRLFQQAHVVVSERLGVQRHTGVPLETRGLVAEVDSSTGRLTVWGAAKVKHFNREVLAVMLGLREDDIRFVECSVGGGFGVRGEFYPEDFLVPYLAVRLGRPVKWIEDRFEHLVASNHSREMEHEVEIAASADGKLLAFRDSAWSSLGGYVRTHGIFPAISPALHFPGPYAWEGFEIRTRAVLTSKTPAGTYRGPGIYEAAFVRERAIDRVAERLGLDPAELRERNLIPAERLPFSFGELPIAYEHGDFPGVFRTLLERGDYASLRARAASESDGRLALGVGVAAFMETAAIGPSEDARVVAEADGSFSVYAGIASVGQGIQTTLAQIAADELGVRLEQIRVNHHDTDVVPKSIGTFASRSTVFGGSAVLLAARDLISRARAAAAARLGVPVGEVELVDGVLQALDGRGILLANLGVTGEGRFEKEHPDWSFGACLALVAVERETGQVRVLRFVTANDIGRAINPLVLRGQLAGAAAQGLAGALLEELAYDEHGQPLATSFVDYLLPTLAELPDVETIVIENPVDSNPLGAVGAGEGGISGAGAAIANAVANALGASPSRLPLRPAAVLALVEGVRGGRESTRPPRGDLTSSAA